MPEPRAGLTVEEENRIAAERVRALTRERTRIFQQVFGPWGSPTAHGKVMLDALAAKFGHALPPNVLDKNDRTDPYQTWRRLGHFDVLEYLRMQLEWKESPR